MVDRHVTLGTNKEKLWEHRNAGKFFLAKTPMGDLQSRLKFYSLKWPCSVLQQILPTMPSDCNCISSVTFVANVRA